MNVFTCLNTNMYYVCIYSPSSWADLYLSIFLLNCCSSSSKRKTQERLSSHPGRTPRVSYYQPRCWWEQTGWQPRWSGARPSYRCRRIRRRESCCGRSQRLQALGGERTGREREDHQPVSEPRHAAWRGKRSLRKDLSEGQSWETAG